MLFALLFIFIIIIIIFFNFGMATTSIYRRATIGQKTEREKFFFFFSVFYFTDSKWNLVAQYNVMTKKKSRPCCAARLCGSRNINSPQSAHVRESYGHKTQMILSQFRLSSVGWANILRKRRRPQKECRNVLVY